MSAPTHSINQGKRFPLWSIALAVTGAAIVGFVIFADSVSRTSPAPNAMQMAESTMRDNMKMPGATAAGGEHAPYEVQGDTVYVNNRICAYSGSLMSQEQLGRFVSNVRYDGPDEKFRGKTLVFNQCCGMCLSAFPEKWERERDSIMRFHGLVPSTNEGRVTQ